MFIPWSLLPLAHACAFGLVAVVARILLVYRRTGATPIAFGTGDSARDFTARCFYAWLPLADLCFVLSCALRDDPGPLLWPDMALTNTARWIGVAVLSVSLLWVAFAQASMGSGWRMGVDDSGHGALQTSGLFARSRHPVYTGIRVTLFGQLLLVLSWPGLCLWIAAELLVQLQARFEEEAMEARHGALYRDYRSAVRRWL
jgi:protein-S-isoprenylcysteine O-methyltransferase Ste14